jgi:hypothetical protein
MVKFWLNQQLPLSRYRQRRGKCDTQVKNKPPVNGGLLPSGKLESQAIVLRSLIPVFLFIWSFSLCSPVMSRLMILGEPFRPRSAHAIL